ncbi:MAG: GEVED domain-containing protein [Pirellulaceae bacterium]
MLAAGALDAEFANGGKFNTRFTDGEAFTDVALQPDGKIVTVGPSLGDDGDSDFRVFRFRRDVDPIDPGVNTSNPGDPTFSGDGMRTVSFGNSVEAAGAVGIQHRFGEFRIVAAGTTFDEDLGYDLLALALLHEDGSIDTTITVDFGADFKGPFRANSSIGIDDELLPITVDETLGASLAIQPDGKILVAGTVNSNVAIARFTVDGALDATFDGDGMLIHDLGDNLVVNDIAVHTSTGSEYQIVVAGTMNHESDNDGFAVRFDKTGSVDANFGAAGLARLDLGGNDVVEAVAFAADDAIILAGSSQFGDPVNHDFVVWKLNEFGGFDTTFGTQGGWAAVAFGGEDYAHDVAIQQDGKIVVVGGSPEPGPFNYDTVALRLTADGFLDNSFSGDGRVKIGFGENDAAVAVAIEEDGHILIAGHRNNGNNVTSHISPHGSPTLARLDDGRARIRWVNRGTGPGNDTDDFDSVYGANAARARELVDEAIDDWEQVIQSFNNFDGDNIFEAHIFADAIAGRGVTHTTHPDTGATFFNGVGNPTGTHILLDDDANAGWYFDPNPDDHSEFTEFNTPFEAEFVASMPQDDDDDFYRTIVHELGHGLGLLGPASSKLGQLLNDVDDDNDGTPDADPQDAGETLRRLELDTDGNGSDDFTVTFTTNGGLHIYEGGGGVAGVSDDLMNSGRTVNAAPTVRQLISDLDARILELAYGYTVAMPSTVETFYAELDQTGHLRVRGDGYSTDETVTIRRSGDELITVVTVAGESYIDRFLISRINQVTVDMGDGNDTITIVTSAEELDVSAIENVESIRVLGGFGDDTLRILGDGTLRDVLFAGGGDNDTLRIEGEGVFTGIDFGEYLGGTADTDGDDRYVIEGSPQVITGEFDGGAGIDTLDINGSPLDEGVDFTDPDVPSISLTGGDLATSNPTGFNLAPRSILSGFGTVQDPISIGSDGGIIAVAALTIEGQVALGANGTIHAQLGSIVIQGNLVLGDGGEIIADQGSVTVQGDVTFLGGGAIRALGDSVEVTGSITFNNAADVEASGGDVTAGGDLSLPAGGTVQLGGQTLQAANLLLGDVDVSGRGQILGAISGDALSSITVEGGAMDLPDLANFAGSLTVNSNAVARLAAGHTIDAGESLHLNNGLLDVPSLTINGGVADGFGGVLGDFQFLSGTDTLGEAGAVALDINLIIGDRTATIFSNADAQLGPVTSLNGGTLTARQAVSAVIGAGDNLVGSGTVEIPIDVRGGVVSPGHSPGKLDLRDVTLDDASTFVVELDGFIPGTDYDQLAVQGTVDLTGATLDLSQLAGLTDILKPGRTFTLIENDGDDAIVGQLVGLPEGTLIDTATTARLYVTYEGRDGNDLVLAVIDTVPTPAAEVVDLQAAPTLETAAVSDAVGNQVVVWDDRNVFRTQFRLFNRAGEPLTDAAFVSSDPNEFAFTPAIDNTRRGDFVVVWRGANSVTFEQEIRFRRFTSAGIPLGDFEVVPTPLPVTGLNHDQDVAVDEDGNIVIVWSTDDPLSAKKRILARRFDKNGNTLDAGDILIHETADDVDVSVDKLKVASADDGRFVAAWELQQIGQPTVILARRFDGGGDALDAQPFQVASNVVSTGGGLLELESDAAGNFLVGWFSVASGHMLRQYTAGGAPADPVVLDQAVDGFPFGVELTSVSAAASGDFAIGFNSDGFGGGNSDDFSAVFLADGQRYEEREFGHGDMSGVSESALEVAMADDRSFGLVYSVDSGTEKIYTQRYGDRPDIVVQSLTDGAVGELKVDYLIEFGVADSFELAFYRSADDQFDPSDTLLTTAALADLALENGSHSISVPIGTGIGEIPLASLGDDRLLVVADHTNYVFEYDEDDFNEDNTAVYIQSDFGDAPDAIYATTLANDGPRHLAQGPRLGAAIDGETDGQPSPLATGDGLDDDGVRFPELLEAGATVQIEVTSSPGGGVLDFYFDFDGQGGFGNTADEVFRTVLSGGTELIEVEIPGAAVTGAAFARFRISSGGVSTPTGPAADGEVEDYSVFIVQPEGLVSTLLEDFDDVAVPGLPSGWSTTSTTGNDWTSVDSGSNSAPNHAFVVNVGETSESRLISPAIAIPDNAQQLTFRNNYGLDDGYDGGVLEISIAGAPFVDILAAGGSFAAGGYGGAVNALGGEQGWTGFSGGYIDTVVNLPAAAIGGAVQLQWRLASDEVIGEIGWRIDDLQLVVFSARDWDYGDAPDPTYPTRSAGNGASHITGGPLFLGSGVDAEADGQPNADATGDDADMQGNDDDGVSLSGGLYAGMSAELTVIASDAGVLNAWIDLNRDGDWSDAGEHFLIDRAVVAGANVFSIDLPDDVTLGETFTRFRLSTQAGLSYDGPAPDGEVEDYRVEFVEPPFVGDFGDAPDSYFTTLSAGPNGGARHLPTGAWVGALRDSELDAAAPLDGTGDDDHMTADEDGVVISNLAAFGAASVTATIGGSAGDARLYGWIDFNGDGDFADVGEQIADGEGQFSNLADGVVSIVFTVPMSAQVGATYARFRVSSEAGLSYDGAAADGEVEDYAVEILDVSPALNDEERHDVDGQNGVDFFDILTVIAQLRTNGFYEVTAGPPSPPYPDVDGNHYVDFYDILAIIAHLRAQAAAAEGESATAASTTSIVVAPQETLTTSLATNRPTSESALFVPLFGRQLKIGTSKSEDSGRLRADWEAQLAQVASQQRPVGLSPLELREVAQFGRRLDRALEEIADEVSRAWRIGEVVEDPSTLPPLE